MVRDQIVEQYGTAKQHVHIGLQKAQETQSQLATYFGICGSADELALILVLFYVTFATLIIPFRMAGYSVWKILFCPCLCCAKCLKVCRREIRKDLVNEHPWEGEDTDEELVVSSNDSKNDELPKKKSKKIRK